MLFLFGKSINPKIRLIIGAVVLVLGIVLHSRLLDVGAAVYLVFSGYQLVRNLKQNVR
jgi:hypothetical protein